MLTLFLLIALGAKAQYAYRVSIDFAQTFFWSNLQEESSGFIIEPVFNKYFSSSLMLYGSLGYANIDHKGKKMSFDMHTNTTYNLRTQGAFIKLGCAYSFLNDKKQSVNFGLNTVYSMFGETLNYTMNGDYFGDYKGNFVNDNNFAFVIEPNLDYCIYLFENFGLGANFRFHYLLYKSNTIGDLYYVPGVGIMDAMDFAIHISIYFAYRF